MYMGFDMERQQRKTPEAVRRHLAQDLKAVDRLLKQAKAPRIWRDQEVAKRIQSILTKIRKAGGRVSKAALGEIAASAGMPPTSVGLLNGPGYIKTDPNDKRYVVLGDRKQNLARSLSR